MPSTWGCRIARVGRSRAVTLLSLGWLSAAALVACGGKEFEGPADPDAGSTSQSPDAEVPDRLFTVGGTVSGLQGSGLILSQAGEELEVQNDGAFTFATALEDGDAYRVAVMEQPSDPEQLCYVVDGEGQIAGADVTDVAVHCTTPASSSVIVEFSASEALVSAGDTISLSWVTREARACVVQPGALEASPAARGTAEVTVARSTTFALTCDHEGELVSRALHIAVTDTDWAEVAAGHLHTCALKDDGRLYCWGSGTRGQLGNGAHDDQLIPVQEATQDQEWAHVSAGGFHTCAIKTDGRLYCWGRGDEGQLGTGSDQGSATPVQEATGASDWIEVSAGNRHTCAINAEHELFCWGRGDEGQLGTGGTERELEPRRVASPISNWTQVSASVERNADFTCAVTQEGALYCWGDGRHGQLGHGSSQPSSEPVEEATERRDWRQVAAGAFHACALTRGDELYCWGSGFTGQLGAGEVDHSNQPFREASEASDWAQLTAGATHTCATKRDDTLHCWGSNFEGQLGNELVRVSLEPLQESTEAADWAQVTAGMMHTCARTRDGRLICFGDDRYTQLGSGAALVPESSASSAWQHLAAGQLHGCAIDDDGTLFCWGAGDRNGIEGFEDLAEPERVLAASSDWTRVSAGLQETCAIRESGELFCWGQIPAQEPTEATDWQQVSVGGSHVCAIKTDRSLYCWGRGFEGQLGHGAFASSSSPVREASEADDWIHVAAGRSHTCAIREGGALYCWGRGANGRLGTGSDDDIAEPEREASLATSWARVSAGELHTCALTDDGRIFCWGDGREGRLGTGSEQDRPLPAQEATLADDWVELSTSHEHSCAIKAEGTLFCWGRGASGRLGTGSAANALIPRQEQSRAANWSAVSAAYEHTSALKADGRLKSWGSGLSSRLAIAHRPRPVWPADFP
jgi:alpha-tubulin suppressor-like RCC1 family protein